MTDEECFVRRICEEPSEDTHRLVYADWLDENPHDEYFGNLVVRGVRQPNAREQQAEFIRLQIRESRGEFPACDRFYDMKACDCPACKLARMEQWRTGSPFEGVAVKWHRGFVSRVELPCAMFMGRAKELFSRHPITEVRLTDKRPWAGNFSSSDAAPNLFGWWRVTGANYSDVDEGDPDTPPAPLMQEMTKDPRLIDSRGHAYDPHYKLGSVLFHHEKTAVEALSEACVTFGRQEAGLPPLPRKCGVNMAQ